MPKIIENVRERAIFQARDLLIREGHAALTVRRVATALGIAPATIYNYFPSKENLIACVMLEDWQKLMRDLEVNQGPASAEETVRALFSTVQSFTRTYISFWTRYAPAERSAGLRQHYHPVLVEQLSRRILRALPAERSGAEPWLAPFLADLVLRFGSDGVTRYEEVEPAVAKLLR
jgi:AcrR family transcriptional regulator